MPVTHLYSWNKFSESGKDLAEALGIPRIKHDRSRFRGNRRKTVINWGSSLVPQEVLNCNIFNQPELVGRASNKLHFFVDMQMPWGGGLAPRIPEFTIERNVAERWLGEGKTVCARTVLQGSSGEGLSIHGPEGTTAIPNARLYTLYKPKKSEWRVHIVNGEVIHVSKKAKRNDFEGERNTQIRNLANGYVYLHDGFEVPPDVTAQALLAHNASGLDFGAVDVIWNEREQMAYVLEINTAPGLAPTILSKYVEAFRNL